MPCRIRRRPSAQSSLLRNRTCIRMSPPLRTPGSVGADENTFGFCAPRWAVSFWSESATRTRCSAGTTMSQPSDAKHRKGCRCRLAAAALSDRAPRRARRCRPTIARFRIRPTLPRHLPPCLRAGKRPGDRDGVALVGKPDRGTDEYVPQRHSTFTGAGGVLGEVAVDEVLGAARSCHHPVDDVYVSHEMPRRRARPSVRTLPCALAERGPASASS